MSELPSERRRTKAELAAGIAAVLGMVALTIVSQWLIVLVLPAALITAIAAWQLLISPKNLYIRSRRSSIRAQIAAWILGVSAGLSALSEAVVLLSEVPDVLQRMADAAAQLTAFIPFALLWLTVEWIVAAIAARRVNRSNPGA